MLGDVMSNLLVGKWTYRSFKKATLDPWFNGELEIHEADSGVLRATLVLVDFPAGNEPIDTSTWTSHRKQIVRWNGWVSYGDPFALRCRGTSTGLDADVVVDYLGYLLPQWTNGTANANLTLAGSMVRIKDNPFGKQGNVAAWMAVKRS